MTTLNNLNDIVASVRTSGLLGGCEVLEVTEDAVEVLRDGVIVLVTMPSLWQDQQRLAAEFQRLVGTRFLLVCLGSVKELEAVYVLDHLPHLDCVALPTSEAALGASLNSSISSIAKHREAQQRGQLAERYRFELGEIISIATAINSERDINKLLGLILEKSRYISGADAGSVYVVIPPTEEHPERRLRFAVAQNDSLDVDFKATTLNVSRRSIVGSAVLDQKIINIPDLYDLATHNPWGVEHDRSFDLQTGYQTRSVLAVPLITQRDEVVGAIQLINKKATPGVPLRQPDDFKKVMAFDERSVELCQTLAYQAAIALENALLYDELRTIFEGFVEASVQAIESRDPSTSGHSRRVADLTVGLAEAVNRETAAPFTQVFFQASQLKEIEYAGLLHDFGKIGVPEAVLVKAKKLYEPDLTLVLARFDFIRQWHRSETMRRKLAHLQRGNSPNSFPAMDAALLKQEQYLDLCIETVKQANKPTVLQAECSQLIKEIAAQSFVDLSGAERPYLTPSELDCLQIGRGNLSGDERDKIEAHVEHTYRFLCMVPWGRSFQKVAQIAGDHHEKLDGSGYPAGKQGDAIPIQAKMMTIADIFDALTASDRPYKPAVPWERALDILKAEMKAKKLDGDLLRLFIEADVYRRVLKKA